MPEVPSGILVSGIPCLGLNGGPVFRHTEAFSFQIATESQEETDRYEQCHKAPRFLPTQRR